MDQEQAHAFLVKFVGGDQNLNPTERSLAQIFKGLAKKYRWTFPDSKASFSLSTEVLLNCCHWKCGDFAKVFESEANKRHAEHIEPIRGAVPLDRHCNGDHHLEKPKQPDIREVIDTVSESDEQAGMAMRLYCDGFSYREIAATLHEKHGNCIHNMSVKRLIERGIKYAKEQYIN